MATSTFTASDGALPTQIASFSAVRGAMQVRSNAFQGNSSSDESCCRWNADSFNDAQYSQIEIPSLLTSSLYAGAAVRCSNSAETYYGYYEDTSNRYFFKMIAGTYTDLVTPVTGASNTAPDTLRIEANGTTITAKLNGATDGSFSTTDASISSGWAGVCAWGQGFASDTSGDNWDGGNLGGVTLRVRSLPRGVLTGNLRGATY